MSRLWPVVATPPPAPQDLLDGGAQTALNHSALTIHPMVAWVMLAVMVVLALYLLHRNWRLGRRLKGNLARMQTDESHLLSLSTAMEQSPTSIVITGADSRIEYVNPRFTQVTGYSAAEVIGQNPRILNSGLTDHAIFSDMWLTLKQGRRWTGEFVNRRKNGDIFWEEAHIAPVLDANHRPMRYVAVKLDITARKRAESQARSRNRVLELLATMAPLREILEAIIGDIEAGNPEIRCGILLVDEEDRHLVTGAAPNLPDFFNSALDGLEIGPEIPSCGAVVHYRKRIVADNIQTHHFWNPAFRELADRAKLAACWAEPILSASGAIIGAFAAYHSRPRGPDDTELAQLEQSARLAAIAIDRTRALEELRHSEERHRLLADNATDIIWTLDLAGCYTYISPSCTRILGYAPEELLQAPLEANLTPQSARMTREAFLGVVEALATGRPAAGFRGELQALRKDGSTVWTEIATSVLRNAEGAGIGILGITRDINERKTAEQALQQLNSELEQRVTQRTGELAERGRQLELSEERLRLAMEASTDGLWDQDLVTGACYFSPAFWTMLGYQPGDFPNRTDSWLDLLHPEDRKTLDGQRDPWQAEGHFEMEFRMRARDGQYRWILSRGRIVARDPQGKPLRALGTHVDISEHKQAEEAIRELNANLEQKVAERTAQLEIASAAKTQFLAHMSHEIRTPMNAILGLTQVLARESPSPDQRILIQQINEAGNTMLRIINDILDFSRIQAGQLRIMRESFSLETLLKRLRNLIMVSAEARGITFNITPLKDIKGSLIGDPLRLEQVLINLCSNAVKFTDRGGVTVTVTQVADNRSSLRLRFEVQDTGMGISPEGLSLLFQPFTQGDASITRRFGGTGLGLAIGRRLVQLMGGEIGATSTPGMGSTFWVELPFERDQESLNEQASPAPASPSPKPEPVSQQRLEGLRVLEVDDNPMNRMLAQRALKLEGAEVTLANDGQQALDILKARPRDFDAVLMDVQMPVMDGLTATRAIRADATLSKLPVFALTAGVLPEEREAALEAGVTDFLTKPLELPRLVEALSTCLRKH